MPSEENNTDRTAAVSASYSSYLYAVPGFFKGVAMSTYSYLPAVASVSKTVGNAASSVSKVPGAISGAASAVGSLPGAVAGAASSVGGSVPGAVMTALSATANLPGTIASSMTSSITSKVSSVDVNLHVHVKFKDDGSQKEIVQERLQERPQEYTPGPFSLRDRFLKKYKVTEYINTSHVKDNGPHYGNFDMYGEDCWNL